MVREKNLGCGAETKEKSSIILTLRREKGIAEAHYTLLWYTTPDVSPGRHGAFQVVWSE